VGADAIGWQRLPDRTKPADVVEAQFLTGGHPSPAGVLQWLRGEATDPWSGWRVDFPQDSFMDQAIRKRIQSAM
jgi:hypothetical protein